MQRYYCEYDNRAMCKSSDGEWVLIEDIETAMDDLKLLITELNARVDMTISGTADDWMMLVKVLEEKLLKERKRLDWLLVEHDDKELVTYDRDDIDEKLNEDVR